MAGVCDGSVTLECGVECGRVCKRSYCRPVDAKTIDDVGVDEDADAGREHKHRGVAGS